MRIPRTEYIGPPPQSLVVDVAGPVFEFPWGTTQITFYCTYTRTDPTGSPRYSFEIGNGVELCRTIVIDQQSLDINTPNASYDFYLEQMDGPAHTGCYIIRLCLNVGERTVRMTVAEVGNPASPGTILVTLTGGGSEQ